jgi:hypothetical protein
MIELLLDSSPSVFYIDYSRAVSRDLSSLVHNLLAALRANAPRPLAAPFDSPQPDHVYTRQVLSLYIQIRMKMRPTVPSNRSPKPHQVSIPAL